MSSKQTKKEMPTHSQFVSFHPRVSLDDILGWEDNGKGKKLPKGLWRITKSVGQGCRANVDKRRHGFTLYAWKPTVLSRLVHAMKRQEQLLLTGNTAKPKPNPKAVKSASNNQFSILSDTTVEQEKVTKPVQKSKKGFVKLGNEFQMGCAPSIRNRRHQAYQQRQEYREKRQAEQEGKTYVPKPKPKPKTKPVPIQEAPSMDSFPSFGKEVLKTKPSWKPPPQVFTQPPPEVFTQPPAVSKKIERPTLVSCPPNKTVEVEYEMSPEWSSNVDDNWDNNASKHVNEIRQDCLADDDWGDDEDDFQQFLNETDEVVFC